MKKSVPYVTFEILIVIILWTSGARVQATATIHITPEYWRGAGVTAMVKSVKPNDPSNMLRVEATGVEPVRLIQTALHNFAPYSALKMTFYAEARVRLQIRIDQTGSETGDTRYSEFVTLEKGKTISVAIPIDAIKANVNPSTVGKILIFSMTPPAGAVFWMYHVRLVGDDGDPAPDTDFSRNLDAMQPDPFIKGMTEAAAAFLPPRDDKLNGIQPISGLLLYHSYEGDRADVLDFSGHGALGEFLTANRIATGPDNTGLRFHGDIRSGQPLGYRIMESDALSMKQGCITLWLWADPVYAKDGVLIASGADKKAMLTVGADRKGKTRIVSTLTGGQALKAKTEHGGWIRLAIAFGPGGSTLYINGKKSASNTAPGFLNGAKGFYVGHDAKFRKGFAGTIDELRIYSSPDDYAKDDGAVPDPAFNPSGLVLHYDFQQTGDSPSTIKDVSGQGLDGQAAEIKKTGVVVTGKNAPNRNDRAWEFDWWDGQLSYILLPRKPVLNLRHGTIMLYFALNAMATGSDPRRVMLGAAQDGGNTAYHVVDFYCYHPNSHADLDPNKVTPFYLVGPGMRGIQKPRVMKMLYNHEWVKLVFSWDERGTTVWLNDMKYNGPIQEFALEGDTSFITLGTNGPPGAHDRLGSSIMISDFKILSYKLTTYTKELTGGNEKKWKAKTPPHFELKPRPDDERWLKGQPW